MLSIHGLAPSTAGIFSCVYETAHLQYAEKKFASRHCPFEYLPNWIFFTRQPSALVWLDSCILV
jgi:hypothetical protein